MKSRLVLLYSIATITSLLLATFSTTVLADPTDPPTAIPEDVLFVLRGIDDASSNAIQQATGELLFQADRGRYQIDAKYRFFVDDEKIRWDLSSAIPGQEGLYGLQSKNAYDGKGYYEFRYLPDAKPYPAAHIRPTEEMAQGIQASYTGAGMDPRHFYLPRDLQFDEPSLEQSILKLMEGGKTVRIEGDVAKDPVVRLILEQSFEHVALAIRAEVDIANGFTLPKIEMLGDGQVVGTSIRTYEQDKESGVFYVKSLVNNYAQPGKKPSSHRYEFTYETINQPIAPETFDFRSFDLPHNTLIYDTRIDGLKYRSGVAKDFELSLDEALAQEEAAVPEKLVRQIDAKNEGLDEVGREGVLQATDVRDASGWILILGAIGAVIVAIMAAAMIFRGRNRDVATTTEDGGRV